MSARNTALLVLGHLPAAAVVDAFRQWPDFDPRHFAGDECPRVGHTDWHGTAVTHVALRLFEVAGIRLLDEDPTPEPDDLEMVLGRALSLHHPVVFALYEDETMAGGGARFEAGRLVHRTCIDGRRATPVRRDLLATTPLADLDPSDWIWPHASEALQAAFGPGLRQPPRTDDDLEALILAADAQPVVLGARPTPPRSVPPASAPRRRDRLRASLRSWLKRAPER